MKKNEENLEVVDVEFTPYIREEILVEANAATGDEKSPRQEQLIGEGAIIVSKGIVEDNERSKQKQDYQKEDSLAYQGSQANDERTSRDTSFRSYAREEISKERIKKRGFLARISRFCLITLGIILAMPMLITGAGVVVGGVVASLGVIAVGLAGVAFTAFLITVQPGLIGWLGVFISLGLLSGGGLALCLMILLMRGLRYIIRVLRNTESNRDTIAREK